MRPRRSKRIKDQHHGEHSRGGSGMELRKRKHCLNPEHEPQINNGESQATNNLTASNPKKKKTDSLEQCEAEIPTPSKDCNNNDEDDRKQALHLSAVQLIPKRMVSDVKQTMAIHNITVDFLNPGVEQEEGISDESCNKNTLVQVERADIETHNNDQPKNGDTESFAETINVKIQINNHPEMRITDSSEENMVDAHKNSVNNQHLEYDCEAQHSDTTDGGAKILEISANNFSSVTEPSEHTHVDEETSTELIHPSCEEISYVSPDEQVDSVDEDSKLHQVQINSSEEIISSMESNDQSSIVSNEVSTSRAFIPIEATENRGVFTHSSDSGFRPVADNQTNGFNLLGESLSAENHNLLNSDILSSAVQTLVSGTGLDYLEDSSTPQMVNSETSNFNPNTNGVCHVKNGQLTAQPFQTTLCLGDGIKVNGLCNRTHPNFPVPRDNTLNRQQPVARNDFYQNQLQNQHMDVSRNTLQYPLHSTPIPYIVGDKSRLAKARDIPGAQTALSQPIKCRIANANNRLVMVSTTPNTMNGSSQRVILPNVQKPVLNNLELNRPIPNPSLRPGVKSMTKCPPILPAKVETFKNAPRMTDGNTHNDALYRNIAPAPVGYVRDTNIKTDHSPSQLCNNLRSPVQETIQFGRLTSPNQFGRQRSNSLGSLVDESSRPLISAGPQLPCQLSPTPPESNLCMMGIPQAQRVSNGLECSAAESYPTSNTCQVTCQAGCCVQTVPVRDGTVCSISTCDSYPSVHNSNSHLSQPGSHVDSSYSCDKVQASCGVSSSNHSLRGSKSFSSSSDNGQYEVDQSCSNESIGSYDLRQTRSTDRLSGGRRKRPRQRYARKKISSYTSDFDASACANIMQYIQPSLETTISKKLLISRYVDFLLLENEYLTQLSKTYIVPTDLFVTEEMYKYVLKVARETRIPFPTAKFLHWTKKFYPKLQLDTMDYCLDTFNFPFTRSLEGKQNEEVLEDIFFFFQRKILQSPV